ncbi:MAG: radical SAM protein [Alphaproteobacteria bacterium]|nr:radical SAM protein [Alphaproteobacteria bacterium]
MIERVSIELTNACSKACAFCYNRSHPSGATHWTADALVGFVTDLAANGVQAVSFGGGEPLEHPEVFAILERTRGLLFRSLTTNGLLLDGLLDALVAAGPDKVHVSIHQPGRAREVDRVVRQVLDLADRGIPSGVNLLVRASAPEDARRARLQLQAAGIGPDRTMFLPMRGADTPSPRLLAEVAGATAFQSMTCLLACGRSPRFASVGWDGQVAWCSYTTTRRPLPSPDHAGLLAALDGLGLAYCG